MLLEKLSHDGIDYSACRYGSSKQVFRGPERPADGTHIAFLGSGETFGRRIREPFPELVEQATGRPCLNLAVHSAGPDAFLNDADILGLCRSAAATVVQVLGAPNMSNRMYAVHPRRNDRFVRASSMMRSWFPDADFAEFNFTRHMLNQLQTQSPERFDLLAAELREAWVARMETLLGRIGGKIILLWLSDHEPNAKVESLASASDPLLVDHQMIAALAPRLSGVVEIVASPEEIAEGLDLLSDGEGPSPADGLGPLVHRRAAAEISAQLTALGL